jgi:hypothetical protein
LSAFVRDDQTRLNAKDVLAIVDREVMAPAWMLESFTHGSSMAGRFPVARRPLTMQSL